MLKDRAIEVKENVKNHIKRNQNKYYVCGVIVVTGATVVITRRMVPMSTTVYKFMPYDSYLGVLKRYYGPNWKGMVRCKETGAVFHTQQQTARAMKLSEAQLSQHLNRTRRSVKGYHFERMAIT